MRYLASVDKPVHLHAEYKPFLYQYGKVYMNVTKFDTGLFKIYYWEDGGIWGGTQISPFTRGGGHLGQILPTF